MNRSEYSEREENISALTGLPAAEGSADSVRDGSQECLQWIHRLRSLPAEQQAKISRKYYGGAMPWKEGRL